MSTPAMTTPPKTSNPATTSTLAPMSTGPTGSPIHPQRLFTLLTVELRKLVDTRTGKAVLGLSIAIPVIALGWLLMKGTGGDVSWQHYAGFMAVLSMTIPLIGLFAMTSEWTQRTALTTFTLSPRRGRVLLMKFIAALAVSMAVLAVVIGLTVGATALGGLIEGVTPSYGGFGADVRGMVILIALQVTMAAGFGALAAQTAVAVGAFLVAPTLWAAVGTVVFGSNAQWLDVFTAYNRLASDNPLTDLPQTLTAITFWVVLPTTVGIIRSLRREVK